MKKVLSGVLCLMLILTSVVHAGNPQFTDVKSDSWYYNDVMNAVALGLINGKTETTYCPDNNLTYAEAFKLAACMHQLATKGAVTLKNGTEQWYSTYIEYCTQNGIYDALKAEVANTEFDPNANITRSGYMYIFSRALPSDMLPAINYVPYGAIPDISLNVSYTEGVYRLYRAGILQGSDAQHSCKPFDNIKRSEVAAILTRMMDKTKRVRFDMGTPPKTEPFVIEKQPISATVAQGANGTTFLKVSGGAKPYTYKWQLLEETWTDIGLLAMAEPHIKSMITGYDKDTLTITSELAKDFEKDTPMTVRCLITDSMGATLTSDTAVLTFKGADTPTEDKDAQYYFDNPDESRGENPTSPIKVTVSGTEFRFLKGDRITVKVQATGGTIPDNIYRSYRWYRYNEAEGKWVFYTGGTYHPTNGYNPSLNFYESLIEVPGETFKFKCVVKDQEGYTGESEVVTITTSDFMLETELPENIEVVVGEDVGMHVKVKGGKAPYTYKWYIAEFVIPTKTYQKNFIGSLMGDTVKFTMLPEYLPKSDNVIKRFGCIVTDAEGSEVDTSAMIVDKTPKDVPLTIVSQPKRITSTPKYLSNLQFDISVHGGTEPYTYEWFFDEAWRKDVTPVSLLSLTQTADSRISVSGSTLTIKLIETSTVIDEEIYCVVTDAKGNTVKSEKVAVCPDFVMITLEEKIEIANIGTQYVGTVKCGTLVPGDRIGFVGYFDGKYEYVSGTVDRIVMFNKGMDKAEPGDRVGMLLKNIKTYEKSDDLKEVIGDPEYRTTRNMAFKLLSTDMTVTTEKNAYYVTPGKYTHLTVYITGGNEDYVSCEWFKEVDGEWVSFGKDKDATYSESKKCYWMQCTYHGEKEYASYRAKCIVTDSAGNKAESNIVTLTTSDIGFETELPKETKVSSGQKLTLTVKPKGGKGPYTYKWYNKTIYPDSSSSVAYFENIKSSTGHNTDTLTFEVNSSYISSDYGFPDEIIRCVGCTITDANGATVSTATILIK